MNLKDQSRRHRIEIYLYKLEMGHTGHYKKTGDEFGAGFFCVTEELQRSEKGIIELIMTSKQFCSFWSAAILLLLLFSPLVFYKKDSTSVVREMF